MRRRRGRLVNPYFKKDQASPNLDKKNHCSMHTVTWPCRQWILRRLLESVHLEANLRQDVTIRKARKHLFHGGTKRPPTSKRVFFLGAGTTDTCPATKVELFLKHTRIGVFRVAVAKHHFALLVLLFDIPTCAQSEC